MKAQLEILTREEAEGNMLEGDEAAHNLTQSQFAESQAEEVQTRYYEIDFGKKNPRLDRKKIEAYVLTEKRLRNNGRHSFEVTSGDFNVKEVYQERVASADPGLIRAFDTYDNVLHMLVTGTREDFSHLEQTVLFDGKGKIVQVRECNVGAKLCQYADIKEDKRDKQPFLSQSAKNYLIIMSVPATILASATSVYAGTHFAGFSSDASGLCSMLTGIAFGVASGIYAGLKTSGEIK